ncbi:MAG: hypothetical protein U0Q18_02050 [Bryobacteraceae bacterium]
MKIRVHYCSQAFLTTALAAICLFVPSHMHAEQSAVPNASCTAATLAGGYGAVLSGVQINGTSTLNVAVAGRLVADGQGHITSMTGTVSLAGIVVSASGSGTYTIGPACTGSATLNTNVIPTVHMTFTLVSGNTKALAIGTDSTYVVTGEIDKQ